MLTRTLATLAFALFTVSSPLPAGPATYNFKYRITNLQTQKVSTRNELLVFNPTITYPTAGVQWVMGETYTVTWETSNFPPEEESKTGLILLGHSGNNSENLDIDHPLENHFPLSKGCVNITIPLTVEEGDEYFIVLFGDSGNTSPSFSIVPPATNSDNSDSLS